MSVSFFEEARDADLKFAVIAAKYQEKWLLCRHRSRDTWELPGGHREEGESIWMAARRELREETGAVDYQLEPVAAYQWSNGSEPGWGGLFYADIRALDQRPEGSEIAENREFECLPTYMTYPEVHPVLLKRVEQWLADGNFRSELDDLWEMIL